MVGDKTALASKFTLPKMAAPQFDTKKLRNFDWRSLQKYASPQASEDLNKFLEKMPTNVGQTMLIVAAVAWSCAGALGLYTTVQLRQLTELRAGLQEADALQPVVPTITDVAIDAKEVGAFIDRIKGTYKDLDIRASGATVNITSKSTINFGQWREAIGHIQNGGSGWRVNIDNLCVGRECKGNPLSASLKINKVSVNNPNT